MWASNVGIEPRALYGTTRKSNSLIDIPTTNGFLFDFYKFLKIGELKKIIDNDSPVIIHSQDSYISGCVLFPFRKSNSKLKLS